MDFCNVKQFKYVMKKTILITISIMLLVAMTISKATAQQETFKPGGKPVVTLFTNYGFTKTGESSIASFNLERAYIGFQYDFSEVFSAKVVFDVGDPGIGQFDYAAYAKNAYLQYSPGNLTLAFGMIGTTYFSRQEKLFPYRYIVKSFQDEYKISPSADLGFTASYAFGDFAIVDFMAVNGEGYKNVQADSTFRYVAGINLEPVKGLFLRGSFDIMPGTDAQKTATFFGTYSLGPATLGFEYTSRMNQDMDKGRNIGGYSFTASANVFKKVTLFGRYDKLGSDVMTGDSDPWNLGNDGSFLMLGFDYTPLKGVRIAPNYQGWFPEDESMYNVSSLLINVEIKF